MKFIEDFKKFIFKGNVIDMAVGVVIGASFGKIVTGLVNYIINPFVGIFVKSGNLDSVKTVISEAVYDEAGNVVTAENAILWGTWIQTIIDFLLTALCIFIVLRILMKAKNTLEHKKIEAEKKKAEEENRKLDLSGGSWKPQTPPPRQPRKDRPLSRTPSSDRQSFLRTSGLFSKRSNLSYQQLFVWLSLP